MDDVLTVPEAAKIARLGRSTLYLLIAQGDVPVVRIGRAIRIRRLTLEKWLASHEHATVAERSA